MTSTLVVGYDGSPSADAALDAALGLGGELGAGVVVAFGYYANPVGGEVTDYRQALADHGQALLAGVEDRGRAAGVELETVVIEEQPAQALADLGRQRDARAIIVGSHGETPLRGALVGSTAHKLLHLAGRPVLVVPAPGGDR
jgi:nucleotide-binding universal stress UspA family protein